MGNLKESEKQERSNLNRGYQKLRNLISQEQFERLDSLCYKLENELIRLIKSLEKKKHKGDWIDHMVKEEQAEYGEMG